MLLSKTFYPSLISPAPILLMRTLTKSYEAIENGADCPNGYIVRLDGEPTRNGSSMRPEEELSASTHS